MRIFQKKMVQPINIYATHLKFSENTGSSLTLIFNLINGHRLCQYTSQWVTVRIKLFGIEDMVNMY